MKVTKTHDNSVLPTRKHPNDAGLDLYACEVYFVPPHDSIIVNTGIAVELPPMYFGLVFPKSKNNHLVGAGVVDNNYRGSIYVKIVNYNDEPLYIKQGEAVAQLVLVPCYCPALEEVEFEDFQTNTDRGTTGGIASQYKTATFTTKIEKE
jgi:dUTP pyrophosphatase